MFKVIVTSKTRYKLLVKFFLFDKIESYLRSLEKEFNESPNGIRKELKHLSDAGFLVSENAGRIRYYKANPVHPLYTDLRNIMRKSVGIEQILYLIVEQLDDLDAAYITGSLANGLESGTTELVLLGAKVADKALDRLVKKTEKIIKRSIICFALTEGQMKYLLHDKPKVLIWSKNQVC